MRMPLIVASALIGCLAATSHAQIVTVEKQPGLRLSGASGWVGYVDPSNASSTVALGAELGLGSLLKPWFNFGVGVGYWKTDLNGLDAGQTGDVADAHLSSRLRLDVFNANHFVPYVFSGISLHLVRADVPGDPVLEDALGGFQPGFDVGVGLGYQRGGVRYTTEFRRQFVDDVGNWSLGAGIAWWPKRTVQSGMAAPQVRATPTPAATQLATAAAATPEMVRAEPRVQDDADMRSMVQQLLEENRALQRELAQLKVERARDADRAPSVQQPNRLAELEAALGEVAKLSGEVEALRRTSDGLMFMMPGSILFAFGSSSLEAGALEEIRRLAVVAHRFQDFNLVIEGHTDAIGAPETNRMLSQRRAEAVKTEFVRLGLQPDRIQAVGLGSERPIADNRTAEGRARNRRVELRFNPTLALSN